MASQVETIARYWHRSPELRGWVLLAPILLLVAGLMIAPLAFLVAQSFWTQTSDGLDRTPSLQAYVRLLGSEGAVYRMLLLRSLEVSLVSAAIVMVVAFPLAWFLAFRVSRSRTSWLLLVTLPFWISYLLRIFSWKIMLGFGGALNSGLMTLGLTSQPIEALMYNRTAVLITLAHSWSAFAVLPIYVSLQKLDRSVLEASADLGDRLPQRIRRIVLPLVMPGLLAAFFLVFVPTMGDYITPALVGGTDGTMIGNAISTLFGRQNDPPLGAALSVVTMGAVALTVAAVMIAVRGLGLWKRLP